MLNGHGDDTYKYKDIKVNFSSNVYNHFDHSALFAYLGERLSHVVNYPEPTPVTLEKALACSHGLMASQVMVTNGATEAIYLIAQAYRGSSSYIMQPTFAEYADACRLHAHTVHGCGTLLGGADACSGSLFWFCNPNNPTGEVLPKAAIMSMIEKHPDVVFVIDASYAPFTAEALPTAAELAAYDNVLMLHSMTKEYAIPGLRLGYITGNESLLKKIGACRMPWSVNQLAQDAGLYLLSHKDDYQLDVPRLMSERKRVAEALQAIGGIEVHGSGTHILLCRVVHGTASKLKELLAEHYGLLIRDASNFEGLSQAHFRIAIQTPAENDMLLHALSGIGALL